MDWTNNAGRNVRVRGQVIEPGDSVEIENPTAAEQAMFGDEGDEAPRRNSRPSKRRGGKANAARAAPAEDDNQQD